MDKIRMPDMSAVVCKDGPAGSSGSVSLGEVATGFFFVRCENKYYKISLSGIRYIEAQSNYCRVVTEERLYLVLARLHDFTAALPFPAFCQIHRSTIVALSHVNSFNNTKMLIGEEELAIGRNFLDTLMAAVPTFKPLVRRRML